MWIILLVVIIIILFSYKESMCVRGLDKVDVFGWHTGRRDYLSPYNNVAISYVSSPPVHGDVN